MIMTDEASKSEGGVGVLREQFQAMRGATGVILSDKISRMLQFRQLRSYNLYLGREQYLNTMWDHLGASLDGGGQEQICYTQAIAELVAQRGEVVSYDVMHGAQEVGDPRPVKPEVRQNHQEESREIRIMPDMSLDKLKEYEQFVREEKRRKQERADREREDRKREEEARERKSKEQKEREEKKEQERREERENRAKQAKEEREKEKEERERREKEAVKSTSCHVPLFMKLESEYSNRYMVEQVDRMSKMKRQAMSVDVKAIEQHQRQYEQMRQERERRRKERMEEQERLMILQEKQVSSRYNAKYSSSNELGKFTDEKERMKALAKQKQEKIKKYIQETVKEKYLPRVDEDKRKEFLKAIEEMGRKRLRKIRRDDGEIQYEEVKPSDHRMLGLEYLQKTKEIANKMRLRKKSELVVPKEEKVAYDYLAEMRSRPRKSNMTSMMKNLTFQEKVRRVEVETERLEGVAKQREMKLKYGKFNSSEEILEHKEQIDQNYIDIIHMKLKLITNHDP